MFFFLIQTEQGDIFKVTLETDDDVVSYTFCFLETVVYVDLLTFQHDTIAELDSLSRNLNLLNSKLTI